MANLLQNTATYALFTVAEYLKPGDVAIDATCGNGHDTLTLAKLHPSKLYAFDVQAEALQNTLELLQMHNAEKNVELIHDSHEKISDYVKEPIKAAVFNLGYLPGQKKDIITKTESTLKAVKSCIELLAPNGIISITMYSGHPGGAEEKEALLDFAKELDSRIYHCAYISMINQRKSPPEILFITKKERS